MSPRRWRSGHVVVAVEAACGLGIAGYFVHLGVTAEAAGLPGRSVLDRALPFALAVAAVAAVALLSPRRWRRAHAEPPLHPPVIPPPAAPHDLGPLPASRDAGPHHPVPEQPRERPELSDEGRRELRRVLAALAGAGLFAPRVPEAAALEESVADRGEPVTVAGVLSAPSEAPYWHPGLVAEDHLGGLVEDGWKGEQLPETLRATIADLAALVADVLEVRLEDLDLAPEGRYLRHRLTLVLGSERVVLDYLGDHKWLSTVPHVAVARAVRATGSAVRLASYGDDQSLWIAALRNGATVEGLNAALGPVAAPDPWEWLDEQEPFAAGAFRLAREGQ